MTVDVRVNILFLPNNLVGCQIVDVATEVIFCAVVKPVPGAGAIFLLQDDRQERRQLAGFLTHAVMVVELSLVVRLFDVQVKTLFGILSRAPVHKHLRKGDVWRDREAVVQVLDVQRRNKVDVSIELLLLSSQAFCLLHRSWGLREIGVSHIRDEAPLNSSGIILAGLARVDRVKDLSWHWRAS
jgi:hypothetical protein